MRARRVLVAVTVTAASVWGAGQAVAQSRYRTVALDAIAAHWPSSLRADAARVAWCESRYRYDVVSRRNQNGTRDHGLFQLNDGGTLQSLGLDRESALDPYANSAAAYQLFRRRGWQPWVCA